MHYSCPVWPLSSPCLSWRPFPFPVQGSHSIYPFVTSSSLYRSPSFFSLIWLLYIWIFQSFSRIAPYFLFNYLAYILQFLTPRTAFIICYYPPNFFHLFHLTPFINSKCAERTEKEFVCTWASGQRGRRLFDQ